MKWILLTYWQYFILGGFSYMKLWGRGGGWGRWHANRPHNYYNCFLGFSFIKFILNRTGGAEKKNLEYFTMWWTSALGLNISTWGYENWVSKHFVISLNFPCVIASLLSCLLVSFFLFVLWLDICVEVAVDRISRISIYTPPPSLPPFFLGSYPQFFIQHKWQLFEIRARLKLASAAFSSYHFVIGHLEKRLPESIM